MNNKDQDQMEELRRLLVNHRDRLQADLSRTVSSDERIRIKSYIADCENRIHECEERLAGR